VASFFDAVIFPFDPRSRLIAPPMTSLPKFVSGSARWDGKGQGYSCVGVTYGKHYAPLAILVVDPIDKLLLQLVR